MDDIADEQPEAEPDEKMIATHEKETTDNQDESIFNDFSNLVEMVVQQVLHTLPSKMSTTSPNGFRTAIPFEETPSTDAHIQTTTPSAKASTTGDTTQT